MSSDIQISVHEAIVIDLENACANGFLEQDAASVFFIGKQFGDCFSIPYRPAGRGWDVPLFQANNDLSKAVTIAIPFKNPANYLSLIVVYRQLTIGIDCVSVAPSSCHLGTAVPETLSQASFD